MCVCECASHLTVITLHMVVLVHRNNPDGFLRALVRQTDSQAFTLHHLIKVMVQHDLRFEPCSCHCPQATHNPSALCLCVLISSLVGQLNTFPQCWKVHLDVSYLRWEDGLVAGGTLGSKNPVTEKITSKSGSFKSSHFSFQTILSTYLA